ncbi:MAG TPA: nuclear transport factor 2 family protein [Thermoleophilaceae bacterium]|nr:nuclear transport factor 2 family protein [Thermoleophilaceae bacterium]
MSQENVETVRRLYRAFNSFGLQAVVEFAHPDMEAVPPPDWPEASTVRGVELIQAMARQWVETFASFEVEPERFLDAGPDRVVAYVRDRGLIKGSDAEIDTRFVHLWTLKEGKIVRWEVFADEGQALEAAGLSA